MTPTSDHINTYNINEIFMTIKCTKTENENAGEGIVSKYSTKMVIVQLSTTFLESSLTIYIASLETFHTLG